MEVELLKNWQGYRKGKKLNVPEPVANYLASKKIATKVVANSKQYRAPVDKQVKGAPKNK